MKRLAQGALAESDLAEELPYGTMVDFPGEIRRPEGNTADGAEDFMKVENAEADAQGENSAGEDTRTGNSGETEESAETAEVDNGLRDGTDPKSSEAEYSAAEKELYFGSVRFFKNMILLAVILFISVPTILAVAFWRNGRETAAMLKEQRDALSDSLTDLQAQYDQLATDKLAEETIWGGSVAGQVVKTEPLDYQTLYPDFYADTPVGPTAQDKGTMYLTFDDGPSSNTPLLLSILRSKNVKATFFVVGGDTAKQRQWMRDIVEDGHTLGMHSYTHNYHQIYASVEAFLDDYYKLFTNIKEATGQTPTIFRFPGGSVNSYDYPVYREIVAEMLRRGFLFYDWNLSSGDASSNYISPKRITANILDNAPAFSRGIVLFHDAPSKDSTVEALAGVIDGLREQGFTLAPLTREVRPILFNYTDYQPD